MFYGGSPDRGPEYETTKHTARWSQKKAVSRRASSSFSPICLTSPVTCFANRWRAPTPSTLRQRRAQRGPRTPGKSSHSPRKRSTLRVSSAPSSPSHCTHAYIFHPCPFPSRCSLLPPLPTPPPLSIVLPTFRSNQRGHKRVWTRGMHASLRWCGFNWVEGEREIERDCLMSTWIRFGFFSPLHNIMQSIPLWAFGLIALSEPNFNSTFFGANPEATSCSNGLTN